MSRQTTNYGLTKPDYTDTADIEVINSNMDIVDEALNNLTNKVNANTETIENLDTTKANKSTTLAGYGITDAYTKTQTDKLLNNKVDKEAGKGLFSGSYNDLTDAPTIPSKTSELQNDSGYLTEHQDLSSYATNTQLNQALENKADKATTLAGYGITDAQEKLTNPLTKSMVVNNWNQTDVDLPLSANMGYMLRKRVDGVSSSISGIVAKPWSSSETYTVGSYCNYGGYLWKCLVQHSGQTPQEGTYWTKVSLDTLGAEISAINSNLANITVDSLINGVSVTSSTFINISTYNSRKITDYHLLVFSMQYTVDDIRQTLIIPSSVFAVPGRAIYLVTNSGADGSIYNQIAVEYINTTTVRASLGSGVCKILCVYGIRLK